MVRLTRIHLPRLYILVSLSRPRGDTPGNFIQCTADARSSNSLIIHEEKTKVITPLIKVHLTRNFFYSLFEKAFKIMKNSIYFSMIALLVAELFKILDYANLMTCDVTLWR